MRQVKLFALATALLLGSTSLAATSTPDSYDQATLQLAATGTAQEAVNFTVPKAEITIPGAQVFPGNSFTVTIPVTNTSDREIEVKVSSVTTGALGDKLTAETANDTVTIAPAGTGNLVYTFTLADAVSGDQSIEGKAFTVTFNLMGTSVNEESENTSF